MKKFRQVVLHTVHCAQYCKGISEKMIKMTKCGHLFFADGAGSRRPKVTADFINFIRFHCTILKQS